MNEKTNEQLEMVLAGLEPPRPPKDLRARALAAARRAADEKPPRDVWSAIWNSRGFRLAWAAAVVALVAGNLLVGSANGVTANPDPQLMASNGVDTQIVDLFRPVRISGDVRSMVGSAHVDETLIFDSKGDPS